MAHEDKKTIAVFFTHGVSLELWEKRGMFSREVRFYETLAREVGEIWFFTYGRDDARFASRLDVRIRIFPKRFPIPNLLYGFLLPIIFLKQLKDADMIRIHQMAGAIPALIAHWLLKKPLIVRCGYQWSTFLKHQHAHRIKQWIVRWIESIAYQAAKIVIVATKTDADSVMSRYTIPSQKIHVIPNYIDTDLFKPLNLQKEPRSMCFVGRLEPQKNLLNLLKALQGVDAHLVLYGEGSLHQKLERRAQELDVRVSFRGRIVNENLPAALNACELFILPSLYEGNPKVLLEAMACGLPVIGTDVAGIVSIIEHEKTGLVCKTNPDSIRLAIDRLLADPALRARLGEAAHNAILQSSSLEKAIRKEKALYAFL